MEAKLESLQQVIEKCTTFGLDRQEIENRIKTINDRIWNLRTFLAWAGNNP
jgi:chaperonin cofactor prefoldin